MLVRGTSESEEGPGREGVPHAGAKEACVAEWTVQLTGARRAGQGCKQR